jgi:hypothetical protein
MTGEPLSLCTKMERKVNAMTKKQIIITCIAIAATIFLAAINREDQTTPDQATTVTNTVDSYSIEHENVIALNVWSVSNVQNFVYRNVMKDLEYGKIVAADTPTNTYGIDTQYVYLPNLPFPTNKVNDGAQVVMREISTDSILTNNVIFTLVPKLFNLEVMTIKGE